MYVYTNIYQRKPSTIQSVNIHTNTLLALILYTLNVLFIQSYSLCRITHTLPFKPPQDAHTYTFIFLSLLYICCLYIGYSCFIYKTCFSLSLTPTTPFFTPSLYRIRSPFPLYVIVIFIYHKFIK